MHQVDFIAWLVCRSGPLGLSFHLLRLWPSIAKGINDPSRLVYSSRLVCRSLGLHRHLLRLGCHSLELPCRARIYYHPGLRSLDSFVIGLVRLAFMETHRHSFVAHVYLLLRLSGTPLSFLTCIHLSLARARAPSQRGCSGSLGTL